RAGLTFVAIDRHQARAWIGADEAPFLAGRKAGAAEAAQACIAQHGDDLVRGPRPSANLLQKLVSARLAIRIETDIVGHLDTDLPRRGHAQQALSRGLVDFAV